MCSDFSGMRRVLWCHSESEVPENEWMPKVDWWPLNEKSLFWKNCWFRMS